ncbi:DNA cytosine methyltransferase [Chitinophaga eiseniae]|uniref:DNA cytosine methyltransferase n=1 Tax=Chitinophaga eiseniae TaxID=634771 RepID=A0A847SW13_9BACT|nr:DNA cytosine methyltransferase [Chitinophaga eiseniae]
MVLLDLFSGAGGFALGMMQAGFKFSAHYFSEIDPHAVACYRPTDTTGMRTPARVPGRLDTTWVI